MNSIILILAGCFSIVIGALLAWFKSRSDAATIISGLKARLVIIQVSAAGQKNS